jgi:hypothetical protein
VNQGLVAPFKAWWKAEEGRVAGELYAQAERIEINTAYWKQRCQTLYKLVNGEEAPVTFGYWLTRRAARGIGSIDTLYNRPYINVISEGVSFLENRIGTTHSIVDVSPNDVSWAVREACRDATSALEAIFDEQGVYDIQRLTFRDRATFGLSFIKVVPTFDGKGLDIHRVMPTDMLVDNTKRGKVTELAQVCFVSEDELMEAFGGVDERTDAAIRNAPRAFVQSPSGLISDQRVLLEGWHLRGTGDNGRHVLCLPNCDLVDEDWKKDRFPFAIGKAKPQTAGFYVNGPAFDAVPYQRKVNELVNRIDEGQQAAHGYWVTETNTKIQAKNLGARPRAVIETNGKRPEFYTPTAVQPELYDDLRWWVEQGLRHGFGISPGQSSGEKPAGVTSGRGLRIAVQIEDSRHKSYLVEMEQETKAVGELTTDAAAEINLEVHTTGIESRTLRWSEIASKLDTANVTVFPKSSLPSEPAGQANEIDDRYANGLIDKRTYRRLLSWGDLRSSDNAATAEEDLVEATLDEICRTSKFVAPDPIQDMQVVMSTASARYKLEKRLKAPRKTLRAIQQYMAVAADYVQHPDGQFLPPAITPPSALPPAPALQPMPGPGIGGPPGLPAIGTPQNPETPIPAPPPVQVAPPMGAPPTLP